ncbi:MAG: AraC-like DNA-binding protein [Halioglobus sp.]|jgi:AraC-like DNA-binding protein
MALLELANPLTSCDIMDTHEPAEARAHLSGLLRPHKIMQGEKDSSSPACLRQVVDYIHAHLTHPVTLPDLARVSGIGVRSQRYGESPSQTCRRAA